MLLGEEMGVYHKNHPIVYAGGMDGKDSFFLLDEFRKLLPDMKIGWSFSIFNVLLRDIWK